jgi:hypothetical protein
VVTWTITNFNNLPVEVVATEPAVTFSPNPMPPGGLGGTDAFATETVVGTPEAGRRTLVAAVDLGPSTADITAAVTVPPCVAPPPPEITFTFTKSVSTTAAQVGDTITYTYTGVNTSQIAVDVSQLVDDRLGVLLASDPPPVLQPNESISRTVDYVVAPTDAGTQLVNNAAMSVSDLDADSASQLVTVARAEVALPPDPDEPAPTTTTVSTTTSAPGVGASTTLAASQPVARAGQPAGGSTATIAETGSWTGVLTLAAVVLAIGGAALVATSAARRRRPRLVLRVHQR